MHSHIHSRIQSKSRKRKSFKEKKTQLCPNHEREQLFPNSEREQFETASKRVQKLDTEKDS